MITVEQKDIVLDAEECGKAFAYANSGQQALFLDAFAEYANTFNWCQQACMAVVDVKDRERLKDTLQALIDHIDLMEDAA
jgi:hypothetical protein